MLRFPEDAVTDVKVGEYKGMILPFLVACSAKKTIVVDKRLVHWHSDEQNRWGLKNGD